MKITKKTESYEPNFDNRYDFPIGHIFIMDNKKVIIEKNDGSCDKCDVYKSNIICRSLQCSRIFREDGMNVGFKIIG